MGKKVIFYVVNVDKFFISHRLPLAIEMLNKGYVVYLLSRNTGRFKELNELGINTINVNFNRSGVNPIKEIYFILVLKKLYQDYRPDIIHHVTIKPVIYGSIAAKGLKFKCKIINAISGLGYIFTDGRKGVIQRVSFRLMRYAFSGNVNFIFQNNDDLGIYKNLGFLVKNNYILIKGSGVDPEVFNYAEPVQKEFIEILFCARLLKDKGVNEFMDAAGILKDKWRSKVKFKLVGDIDNGNPSSLNLDELNSRISEGYIEWKGFSKDVRSSIIESDIVCLPSYREGLPKSLVEAMAIGRPIVSTNVPGCKECVDEGVNGFLVEVKNTDELVIALEHLILDQQLRLRMGIASREKMIKELSLERVIYSTMKFYFD